MKNRLLPALAALGLVSTTLATMGALARPASAQATVNVSVARVCAVSTSSATASCPAIRRTDPAAEGSGLAPLDLRDAYDTVGNGPAGHVDIVTAFDNPTAETDLAVYRDHYGLPPLAAGQFQKVEWSGQPAPLPKPDASWAQESSIELQVVSAMCPQCTMTLIEAPSASAEDLGHTVRGIVTRRSRVTTILAGWFAPEGPQDDDIENFQLSGTSLVAAGGDAGAGVTWPASRNGSLAVGGTSLVRDTSSRGWAESAWSGSAGGCSTRTPRFYARLAASGCANRPANDVSAVADPATGVSVYSTAGGGWGVYGGTGVAAAIIGALNAMAPDTAGETSEPSERVWHRRTQFNDITSGPAGTCSVARQCSAAVGWDAPTGIGTPHGIAAFSGPTDDATQHGGLLLAGRPQRALDTRIIGGPLMAGGTRDVDLTSFCGYGTSAAVLNVTATDVTADGYVTVYPTGAVRPLASSLNTRTGRTVANSVTVRVTQTVNGRYAEAFNFAGQTDLVVDVTGCYGSDDGTPVGDGNAYYPLDQPARRYDSRVDTAGPLRSSAGANTEYLDTSFISGGAAAVDIRALAINVTVVNPSDAGYLTLWNGDPAAVPLASTVNFAPDGRIVTNFAVVRASCLDSACSQVRFALRDGLSRTASVVIDVVGFYAVPGNAATGSALRSETPSRIVDSRISQGFGRLGASATGGACTGRSDAVAMNLNITAVGPTAATFLTAFPQGNSRPGTSNVNPSAGEVVASAAQVRTSGAGCFNIYNLTGATDVVVDSGADFVSTGWPLGSQAAFVVRATQNRRG